MTNSLRHAPVATEFGEVTLVAAGEDLTGLHFPEHWHLPEASAFGVRVEADRDVVFVGTKAELVSFLNGERHSFEIPVRTHGEEFSQAGGGHAQGDPVRADNDLRCTRRTHG